MSDEDHTFESTDAGASSTFPQQAGEIRKGSHLMIKGRPCKCIEVSTSKTGKHGHAKAHIVALDIFTGKKYEDLCPTSHNLDVPFGCDCRGADDEDKKVSAELLQGLLDGKTVVVVVQSACNEEKIIQVKVSD
eukprot:CAMPEP_0206620088 /NCGR_PEP_ID=MMETSP0325_2-20121206/61382_1 /ASSEMBLY_ACC=CAM_ASM_000347 /TAXON_ID=2866 /ORGANISM="Crypthecodinium cohnii, Strain Seligo" /LENGTH=132 /DNA_ID=CAMNT_0054142915 /DNA_START=174 /DNA_END=573 /DNA_ORIENTATION=-